MYGLYFELANLVLRDLKITKVAIARKYIGYKNIFKGDFRLVFKA